MTWPPNGPTTAHPYRAAITRAWSDPSPWYWTVDRVDPATGRRDTDLDPLDDGSAATYAEALAAACWTLQHADELEAELAAYFDRMRERMRARTLTARTTALNLEA